jgi:hypothetical protein
MGPIGVPETYLTTNLPGIISQKNDDLVKISLCDRFSNLYKCIIYEVRAEAG